MLYECTITQASEEKRYLVEADNYGEAEVKMSNYAENNLPKNYELVGISRAHSQLSIANANKVVNADDEAPSVSRKIGFSAMSRTAVQGVSQEVPHAMSDVVIRF